ncbi:MAG: GDP-mannose 4,6-dehydratase [Phycisphaerae bacterium]|nr:GDP-mannose 4,6-dehydratase [Phycisphaerae bacterium]
MRTILVTGADGFAGATLLEHLRQQGYTVIAGVRNRARKLALEQRFVRAMVCDVSDAINVARVIASMKPDGVIHLAGTARPVDAANEPLTAYQSIVSAAANVLDAVRRTIPRSRVLLISACDVYGRACDGTAPVTESTPTQPVSTFGSLKVTAESIAHTFHRNYHLDVTIARSFTHTGPRQSDRFFFGAVARQLANWNPRENGDRMELPDLDYRRDVLHVADVAEAYEALLLNGRPNEAYNVCSGTAPTCRELVETMIRATGLTISLEQTPPPDDNDESIPVLWGDNTKVCTDTGWQATRNATDAVTDVLHYHQSRVTTAR